jgi:hypothetical protein
MKVKRIPLAIVAAFFVLTAGVSMHSVFAGRIKQDIVSIDLNDLLAKAAKYANRLEGAVFDFVCREEIKEWINPSLEELELVTITDWTRFKTIRRRVVRPVTRSLIYDYQCIRKGGKIYERRILLKENREEKYEPDAPLKTSIFRYGTNMMGPVGLFGARFQPSYIYTIIGEKKIKGKKTVIVKAVPRVENPTSTNLYGKAWIAVDTGDILKIEWNEHRIGHYEIFEERGKKFKRKPRITVRTEFQIEKNGLRFPTDWYIEEAYLTKHGRAFIRSRTWVTYKDFKFFTVEVHIWS